MKKIEITIEHNLTPMHQEILETSVRGTVDGFQRFWNSRSKKKFDISTKFID